MYIFSSSKCIEYSITCGEFYSPVTNVSCFGYNDGSVVVNVTGGTGTLSYSINGGITSQSSNIFSSLTSGNYTVLVTDAQGCSVTANVIITEPDEIVINIAVTDASCGVSNGSITLNASGGAGTLQYSINNGSSYQAGGSFPNQGAGNYQIIVQDANGCIATDVASISNTNAPVISNVSYSSLTCNGSNDGMITISATGEQAHFNIPLIMEIRTLLLMLIQTWLREIIPSSYRMLQDVSQLIGVQLTEPDALLFNTGNTPSTCGNANGALTFNVIGGTAPFNYSIDNGVSFQSSNSFTKPCCKYLQCGCSGRQWMYGKCAICHHQSGCTISNKCGCCRCKMFWIGQWFSNSECQRWNRSLAIFSQQRKYFSVRKLFQ
ncbi:MAG: SprB repeat-containing protein [Bacteroidia bacterium]